MATNAERLADLIETQVPGRNRPTFRRFLSRTSDEDTLGVVADMVEGGAIAAALDLIADRRLASLFVTMANRMQRAFSEFVRSLRSDDMLAMVTQLLTENRMEEAIDLVDSHIVRMSSVIGQQYTFAGTEIADDIQDMVRGLRPSVVVTFNPSNPTAAAEADAQMYDFVREVGQEQKQAIRQAVTGALNEGKGPADAARAYRDAVGLTSRQQAAVDNYRRLLEAGSSDALRRDLRDRRFDPTVTRAVDGEPLEPDQIDRMVERYRERYLQYRSQVIARTESTRALSAANHEAFRQTLESIDLPPDAVEKKWNSTRDGRTRPSHWVMNEQKVRGLDTDFTTGAGFKLKYPGDPKGPAQEVVQCRCVATYRLVLD